MNHFFLNTTLCYTSFFVIGWDSTAVAQPKPKKLETTLDLLETITDNSPDEISYQISMTKKVYRSGESNIITSTIKNISKRKIRVHIPHAVDNIVTYKLFRETLKKTKYVGGSVQKNLMLLTRIEELAPGESCSSECELDFILAGAMVPAPQGGGLGLSPGKYFLKANYHLMDPENGTYQEKFVAAKQLSFIVHKLTDAEKKEQKSLSAAFDALAPQEIEGHRSLENNKLLKQFLIDYPNSHYRLLAYIGLVSFNYKPKNAIKSFSIWKQAYKEGLYNRISEEQRDDHYYHDIKMLLAANKPQEAITLLSKSRAPFLIMNREALEKKYHKKKQPDKKSR